MQKAINKKVKADLKSNIIIRDLDIYYPKGYCPSNNTFSKVQIQGTKDFFHSKELKLKDSNLLYHVITRRSWLKKKIRKRCSGSIGRNVLRSGKNKLQSLASILPSLQNKKIKAKSFSSNKKSHDANNCKPKN